MYGILLDNNATVEVIYEDLDIFGASGSSTSTNAMDHITSMPADGLPAFLQLSSKVTMDRDGEFQKGFIDFSSEVFFRFVVKRTA